jgi:hypothetical protein
MAAFVSVLSPALAVPQDTPKASFRLAKDNEYLFLTVKVETTDIQGLTKGLSPQSIPAILKDDCVTLSLLPDGGKPVTITYSPAGGFGYTKDGIPVAYFKMKYGIGIDGTIGDATDKDTSWQVEAAIPWDALGCAPNTPLRGFLQIRKKGAATVASFPDGVDAATPATWPTLSSAPFMLLSKTTIPLIDGRIDKTEWAEAEVQVPLPAWQTKQTSTIITVQQGVAPTLDETRNTAGIKPIGALYFASTNADLLKPSSPTRGVIARDGSIGFIDQPFLGMGPWYSSDRVDHHRRELLGMQRAGIDVAFCVTGGTGVAGNSVAVFYIYRNASAISTFHDNFYHNTSMEFYSPVSMSVLDSPATTSSTTYTVYFASGAGTQITMNANSRSNSIITLMEIAG